MKVESNLKKSNTLAWNFVDPEIYHNHMGFASH